MLMVNMMKLLLEKKLFKDTDKYLGLNVFKANDLILEELGEALLKSRYKTLLSTLLENTHTNYF